MSGTQPPFTEYYQDAIKLIIKAIADPYRQILLPDHYAHFYHLGRSLLVDESMTVAVTHCSAKATLSQQLRHHLAAKSGTTERPSIHVHLRGAIPESDAGIPPITILTLKSKSASDFHRTMTICAIGIRPISARKTVPSAVKAHPRKSENTGAQPHQHSPVSTNVRQPKSPRRGKSFYASPGREASPKAGQPQSPLSAPASRP